MIKISRRVGVAGVIAALSTLGALSAFAAEEFGPGRFSISASAGYLGKVRLAELVPLTGTADVPDVTTRLEPGGPEIGFSLGYRLAWNFELELAAGAAPSRIVDDVGIGFAGVPLGRFEAAKATLWSLDARAVLGFGRGRISPYIAAGFGMSVLAAGDLGSKARPSLELAAGARIRVSPRFRVEVEVADAVSFFRYFEDFSIAYVMIYTAETHGLQHRLGARAALRYMF